MGMDVYGKKPKTEVGAYFRNNVWYWHPLWEYCVHVLPDVAGKVQNAHSNDGDGLGFVDSRKLAFALRKSIDSGAAQKYIDERQEYIDDLPTQPCFCTGVSLSESYSFDGEIPFPKSQTKAPNPECHQCKGTGQAPHFESYYFLTLDNISNFSQFLFDCGGFEIC